MPDAWGKFFWSDYFGSLFVDELNADEERAYFRLLGKLDQSPTNSLRSDPATLARLAKTAPDLWPSVWSAIGARFPADPDNSGRVYHVKCREVWSKQRAAIERAGKAAAARWAKDACGDAPGDACGDACGDGSQVSGLRSKDSRPNIDGAKSIPVEPDQIATDERAGNVPQRLMFEFGFGLHTAQEHASRFTEQDLDAWLLWTPPPGTRSKKALRGHLMKRHRNPADIEGREVETDGPSPIDAALLNVLGPKEPDRLTDEGSR